MTKTAKKTVKKTANKTVKGTAKSSGRDYTRELLEARRRRTKAEFKRMVRRAMGKQQKAA